MVRVCATTHCIVALIYLHLHTDGTAKSQTPAHVEKTHAAARSFIILDASFAEGCFLDELAAVRAATLTLINAN